MDERERECREKIKFINFKFQDELEEYKKKIAANPIWAKQVANEEEKKRKKLEQASMKKKSRSGPGATKKQRTNAIQDDDDSQIFSSE